MSVLQELDIKCCDDSCLNVIQRLSVKPTTNKVNLLGENVEEKIEDFCMIGDDFL